MEKIATYYVSEHIVEDDIGMEKLLLEILCLSRLALATPVQRSRCRELTASLHADNTVVADGIHVFKLNVLILSLWHRELE